MSDKGTVDWFHVVPVGQLALFIATGLANTAIDFLFHNIFSAKPFRLSRIKANLLSTTIAMSFSFTINLLVVFSPHQVMLVPHPKCLRSVHDDRKNLGSGTR